MIVSGLFSNLLFLSNWKIDNTIRDHNLIVITMTTMIAVTTVILNHKYRMITEYSYLTVQLESSYQLKYNRILQLQKPIDLYDQCENLWLSSDWTFAISFHSHSEVIFIFIFTICCILLLLWILKLISVLLQQGSVKDA